MRRILCAGLAASALCTASARPAEAWGGGIFAGTVLGLAAGGVIGATIANPYGYYPPPYPYAYPYPPVYAVPPGYPPYGYPPAYYPPPVAYAPPAYVPPAYAPPAYAPPAYAPSSYRPPAASARTTAPTTPTCRSGQFYNTLTGSCDRR